ncbi:MAG: AMP-binding protein [Firmicutes bacterium]|nr:AMP-binding protein [Bacillota bacterium]
MITASDYLAPPEAHLRREGLRGWTLAQYLVQTESRHPEGEAVVDGTVRLSWRELGRRARAYAARLQAAGFVPGDVLALQLPNSWEFIVAHLGAALAGVVTMTLHTPYRDHEVGALLKVARARGVLVQHRVGDRDYVAMVERLARELPDLKNVWVARPDPGLGYGEPFDQDWSADRGFRPPELAPEAPFALIFTSGTQSLMPKGCIHTHDALLSNAAWLAADAPFGEGDTILSASPFTHMFGIGTIHLAVVSGARQVILPHFHPKTFVDLLVQEGVTSAVAVPAQLLDALGELAQHPRSGLRLKEVRTGGVAPPQRLVSQARRLFGCPLVVQWGMSEIGAGSWTRRDDPEAVALHTVGRPAGPSRFAIIDESGREVPAGEVGEVVFYGPSLFRGYLDGAQETRAAYLSAGGFATGDLGFLDPDGRLHFVGRKKDMVNRGGMKVSCREVEEYLRGVAGVREVAVVPYPDPRLGERACAVVRLDPGARIELRDLTAHLDALKVAKYKWPERLLVVDEMPLTPSGKIAKERLRQWVSEAMAAERPSGT